MRVTLKDIAEQTGVSRSVISMYLNRDPRVRLTDEKKHRIDAAVQKLGYRPSMAACALRKGRSKMLGLVLGEITDPYFARLAEACMYFGELHGYQLMFALTSWGKEKEQRALENLLERQVDGIYYGAMLEPNSEFAKKVRYSGTPVLLGWQRLEGFLTVPTDPNHIFREILTFFQGRGHHRMTICTQVGQVEHWAFESHHVDPDLEMDEFLYTNWNDECLRALLKRRPSAIYVTNCRIAGEILRAAREMTPAYQPEIITNYCFPIDLVEEPGLVGYVFCHFYDRTKAYIDLLVWQIEHKGETPVPPAPDSAWRTFYPLEEFLKVRDSLVDTMEKAQKAFH